MNANVSAKERLHDLQEELRARGFVDVKFFFDHSKKNLTVVAAEVADVLQAVVDNRYQAAAPLNDCKTSA